MAGRNRLEYEIAAKDTSKQAVDSAKRNMGSLEGAASKVGGALKAAFSVAAIVAAGRAISNVTSELVKAYGVQEQSEAKLAAAARNNPYLNAASVNRLKQYASQLQRMSTIGDETTLSFAGMLASLGRNEEQIKEIIGTAANLSAALGIDLNMAIRGVNNAMDGNTETLSRYVPELRNLTDEEKAAGEGMRILRDHFDGMAEQMSGTVLGQMEQFKNAWGDLKELLGESLAPIFASTLEFLGKIVEKIAGFITNMRELKAARDAFESGGEITSNQELILAQSELSQLQRTIVTAQANMSRVPAGQRGQTQRRIDELIAQEQALRQHIQQLSIAIEMENRAAQAQQDAAEAMENLTKETARGMGGLHGAVKEAVSTAIFKGDVGKGAFGTASPGKFGSPFGSLLTGANRMLALLGGRMSDYVERAAGALDELWPAVEHSTKHLVKFSNKLNKLGKGPGAGTVTVGYATDEASGVNAMAGIAFRNPGGVNWDTIDQLMAAFGSVVPQLAQLSSAAGVLAYVFQGFMDVVSPFVNGPLQFLIGWLVQMGQVIGTLLAPWLQILSNLYQALGKVLVWLYNNVFRHIGNALIAVFKVVMTVLWSFGQVVTNLVNGLIKLYNAIVRKSKEKDLISNPFGSAPPDMNSGYLSAITLDQITNQGIEAGGTWNNGTPAQYTTGRTINIDLDIHSEIIAGEGGIRELALMIRDEIYAAEALGA